MRHAFLMAVFGHLPFIFQIPRRGYIVKGYETYIGDDGKEKTVPVRGKLINIILY